MSWYGRHRYVSAAERRAKAEKKLAQVKKQGGTVQPVSVQGRTIARSFWGKAWCTNLEAYSDYSNRLPRGRTYARNGSILDLQIVEGRIDALVSGSRLYEVSIRIDTTPKERWSAIRAECAGQIDSLVDLLQGQLSDGVMGVVTRARTGLFPSPSEIHLSCSCPDWAVMCKHVAAVLYGVGNRLDHAPEMLFSLRGVDPSDMVEEAIERGVAQRRQTRGRTLDVDDLSTVFGVDIDFSDDALSPPTRRKPSVGPTSRPQSRSNPQNDSDLPVRAQRVLEIIATHRGVRTPELADDLGVSRSTIHNAIARLKAEGLVVFVGAPRTGGYQCTKP
jgi:uncharacterized Zn finger protein/biotin operon repressor